MYLVSACRLSLILATRVTDLPISATAPSISMQRMRVAIVRSAITEAAFFLYQE